MKPSTDSFFLVDQPSNVKTTYSALSNPDSTCCNVFLNHFQIKFEAFSCWCYNWGVKCLNHTLESSIIKKYVGNIRVRIETQSCLFDFLDSPDIDVTVVYFTLYFLFSSRLWTLGAKIEKAVLCTFHKCYQSEPFFLLFPSSQSWWSNTVIGC